MIRHSEKDRANYPRESFWCKEKETRVKILPRVSANRRSNNWALQSNVVSIILDTLTKISTSGLENLIMLSIFSTPFGKTPGDSRQPPPPPEPKWEASENRTKQRCRPLRQGRKPWHEPFKKGQCDNSSRSSREIRIWVKDFFVASAIARYAAFNLVPKGQMKWLLPWTFADS